MRANDIRELKVEEIQSRIAELEEERFRLNFRAATEPLDDPHRVADLRRVLLVVGLQALRARHHLAVDGVRHAALDRHHHRLRHLVAHHQAGA